MVEVQPINLTVVHDSRGLLSAIQYPGQLPFVPLRAFIITKSPVGTERGGHAHRTCHQLLIATAGSVAVQYDDDLGTNDRVLFAGNHGLHIPPLAWATQRYLSPDASLLVLASHAYDVDDYVDDREEARGLRNATG